MQSLCRILSPEMFGGKMISSGIVKERVQDTAHKLGREQNLRLFQGKDAESKISEGKDFKLLEAASFQCGCHPSDWPRFQAAGIKTTAA